MNSLTKIIANLFILSKTNTKSTETRIGRFVWKKLTPKEGVNSLEADIWEATRNIVTQGIESVINNGYYEPINR